jgi:hypothetical protein
MPLAANGTGSILVGTRVGANNRTPLGMQQRFQQAVNDRIDIEPTE